MVSPLFVRFWLDFDLINLKFLFSVSLLFLRNSLSLVELWRLYKLLQMHFYPIPLK